MIKYRTKEIEVHGVTEWVWCASDGWSSLLVDCGWFAARVLPLPQTLLLEVGLDYCISPNERS